MTATAVRAERTLEIGSRLPRAVGARDLGNQARTPGAGHAPLRQGTPPESDLDFRQALD